ncbi:SPOR domain-containing protein [Tropicimonas sp.]|uniref:SPOR domain-containing protein n=1 Tax=Tropicimonas sp. TaxID=2067044 RepID=UPI003A849A50
MIFHVLGALVSIALIGAGGWWGYKQIMRDVNGVPVVRALEGPFRVAPEAPGGDVADHAGFSVNRVQAVGTASAPEERLVLAPGPVDLTDEDLPAPELRIKPEPRPDAMLAALEGTAEADDAELVAPDPVAPQPAMLTAGVLPDSGGAQALAAAETLTAGVAPLSAAVPAATTGSTATGGGLRPMARPRGDAQVVLASAPAADTATDTGSGTSAATADAINQAVAMAVLGTDLASETPVASIPAGTRLVQFGAYDSVAEADAAWQGIAGKFAGLVADKQKVVVEAQSGDRTFWRLRAAGFADLAEARRFCAALVAERTDCIPVVAR